MRIQSAMSRSWGQELHTKILLDVEVEAIDGIGLVAVIEGTWASPRGMVRTERIVQKVGKRNTILGSRDLVVAVIGVINTTNAQKNLDTLALAVRNVLLDDMAFAQKLGLNAILVLISTSPAVTSEVGARVS